ncbi:MAG: hypothetical protein ACRDPJ_00015 [Nocardioidaceae bacterium]
MTTRFLDIAQAPDEVEPADVVVLHPGGVLLPGLRAAAVGRRRPRRSAAGLQPPAENVLSRGVIGAENLVRHLKCQSLRESVHPVDAMVSVLAGAGLTARYRHRGRGWCVVGLERGPVWVSWASWWRAPRCS